MRLRLNQPRPGLPPSPPAAAPAPSWKVLLALLSLSLSALLWFEGLASSLTRPSVGGDLDLHQLELATLVADVAPSKLTTLVAGEAPRSQLVEQLALQVDGGDSPAPALQRLKLALLERASDPARAEARLRELLPMVEAPRRPLLEALLREDTLPPANLEGVLEPWRASLLVRQLSCEKLGGPQRQCPAFRARQLLLLRLLAVSLMPVILLMAGVLLLGREFWLLARGRLATSPPLVGPPLGLVDTTLLIAGGFVLTGEVLLPQLLQRALQSTLLSVTGSVALAQGLEVLLLYLSLTVVPLLLLWRLLSGAGGVPAGGWLQWGWRPPATALRQAVQMLLLVLPVVALGGWLVETLWRDPGGSNPMLELVLQGSDLWALACFAVTAVVVAPLFEEILFRGVLLPVLGTWLGPPGAVLLSAGLFAAAHLSLAEWIPLFLLGSGLGVLRLRSGRLASCVLLHALWNGLTFANLLLLGS
jgi:membrane protease YdiL (CAAX protease family)